MTDKTTTARFSTPDAAVAEVWKHIPKTPSMWEVVEPLSPPPLWLYEAMDKALTLLPASPSAAQPDDALTVLQKLVGEIDSLMDDSEGVAGLHKNGDIAPWDDLMSDGRYPWLGSLDEARAVCVRPVALPAAPGAQPAQPDALEDERGVSKLCMDLLREMHEAPTMVAGYEALADFTAQAGLGVPVPLRSAQPDAEERGVSDLPPGLVLVATPYRNAPDKWMLIELTTPGRAKVITGGCIETEAEGIAHAHNFAGDDLYAARASAPAAPEVVEECAAVADRFAAQAADDFEAAAARSDASRHERLWRAAMRGAVKHRAALAAVTAERDALRRTLIDVINRGTDGGCTPEVSTEFLCFAADEAAGIKGQRDRMREALNGAKNCMELVLRHIDNGGLIRALEDGVKLATAALSAKEATDER